MNRLKSRAKRIARTGAMGTNTGTGAEGMRNTEGDITETNCGSNGSSARYARVELIVDYNQSHD